MLGLSRYRNPPLNWSAITDVQEILKTRNLKMRFLLF